MEHLITLIHKIPKIWRIQARFAVISLIATVVDYVLYLILVAYFFSPVVSNVIAYSTAVLINFFMHKRFVFELRRKVSMAFLLSISVSVGGLLLSTAIIWALTQYSFFREMQFITKLLTTGVVFFYNFYFKRLAFEKRML